MENDQIIPNALLIPPLERSDFTRGTIPYIINNPSMDWTIDLPTNRQQKFKFDTNECSQLSGCNTMATYCNFLKRTGKFPISTLKWFEDNGYFDDNGKFAFSEQFAGIISGTSINGGSQWEFWRSASRFGVLPRKDLNYTVEESQKFATQEAMCFDYYNKGNITPAMYAKALESLKYISISYEWVWYNLDKSCPFELIEEALKQAPLQIGTPVCMSTWNSGNVKYCGLTNVGHASEMYGETLASWKIQDHYNPYQKTIEKDYFIPLITKGIITPIELPEEFKHTFSQDMEYGQSSEEVRQLQTALVKLNYMDKRYITGNYLQITKDAVFQFQLDRLRFPGIISVILFNRGRYCSTYTRQALNALFGT